MKYYNWGIFWFLIVGELIFAVWATSHMGQTFSERAGECAKFVFFASIPALALGVPTWLQRSDVGPLPGPLLTFALGGIGGIGTLFMLSLVYSPYVEIALPLGFLIQCIAAVFNFVGLRREV